MVSVLIHFRTKRKIFMPEKYRTEQTWTLSKIRMLFLTINRQTSASLDQWESKTSTFFRSHLSKIRNLLKPTSSWQLSKAFTTRPLKSPPCLRTTKISTQVLLTSRSETILSLSTLEMWATTSLMKTRTTLIYFQTSRTSGWARYKSLILWRKDWSNQKVMMMS